MITTKQICMKRIKKIENWFSFIEICHMWLAFFVVGSQFVFNDGFYVRSGQFILVGMLIFYRHKYGHIIDIIDCLKKINKILNQITNNEELIATIMNKIDLMRNKKTSDMAIELKQLLEYVNKSIDSRVLMECSHCLNKYYEFARTFLCKHRICYCCWAQNDSIHKKTGYKFKYQCSICSGVDLNSLN